MRCNDVEELLEDYIDGLLPEKERKELDSHIVECGSCKKECSELKEMINAMRSVSMIAVPVDFTSLVMGRVGKYSRNRIAEWFDFIFTPRVVRWNMATAVSLALLIGFSLYFIPTRNQPGNGDVINVRFQIEMPEQSNVRTVSLAGDFNGWDTETMMLNLSGDNKWTLDVPLEKGCYQYMFVIDGKEWMPDPGARKLVNDGFGGKNSLLEL